MILVGQYDSHFVRRVAIALHLYGLPFERNTLSVFADAEAMRRINPLGRIPSLILDDGEVLIDSHFILDHLDRTVAPERAMTPASGPDRRRALTMIAVAAGAIEKAGAIVYERALRAPARQDAAWIGRCSEQLHSALAHLETKPQTPWLLGPAISAADIMTACLASYLAWRAADLMPADAYPNLTALRDRAEALPAFIACRPSADEAMPAPPSP